MFSANHGSLSLYISNVFTRYTRTISLKLAFPNTPMKLSSPCLLVWEFFQHTVTQVISQSFCNQLSQLLMRISAKNLNVRHIWRRQTSNVFQGFRKCNRNLAANNVDEPRSHGSVPLRPTPWSGWVGKGKWGKALDQDLPWPITPKLHIKMHPQSF